MIDNTAQRGCRSGCCVSMVGDIYLFLATGAETNGAYFLMDGIVPPGGGPPLHVHSREDEAFYVAAGEFEIEYGERTQRLGPTGFVHCRRGVAHRFRNVGTQPGRLLQMFTPAGIERFFYAAGTEVAGADAEPLPVTPADIERLLRAAAEHGIEIRLPEGDQHG